MVNAMNNIIQNLSQKFELFLTMFVLTLTKPNQLYKLIFYSNFYKNDDCLILATINYLICYSILIVLNNYLNGFIWTVIAFRLGFMILLLFVNSKSKIQKSNSMTSYYLANSTVLIPIYFTGPLTMANSGLGCILLFGLILLLSIQEFLFLKAYN